MLARAGHTEGSIDIMRLAGLRPAAVICEVMSADGSFGVTWYSDAQNTALLQAYDSSGAARGPPVPIDGGTVMPASVMDSARGIAN